MYAFIRDKQVKIYIDSSGIPLFKRGYRTKIHKAALNEALAAGLVMLSNWDRTTPFYDTMCGSGTIAIEAAYFGVQAVRVATIGTFPLFDNEVLIPSFNNSTSFNNWYKNNY
mgnify:CR=1 FL=1